MGEALVITALVLLVLLGLGVFVTVKAVRAVRRGVERTGRQVRQTVEETGLKARGAQPGPVGEVARARLELRNAVDSTRRALEAEETSDPSLQEARGLLERLQEHASVLDGELRLLMEKEPDRERVAAQLPEARERVSRIRKSADALRFAAQDRVHRSAQEGFDELEEQIRIESGALRHWEQADEPEQPLSGPSGAGTSGQPVDLGRVPPGELGAGGASPADSSCPQTGVPDKLRKDRPQSAP